MRSKAALLFSISATAMVLAGARTVHAAPVFDLLTDFSTTQGQNGWNYGFFQAHNFTQPSDFKPMIVSADSWVPDHDDQTLFPLGENGKWNQGGNAFTLTNIRLQAQPPTVFFHPNADPSYDFGDLPNSLEMPAAKWTSSLAGTTVLSVGGLIGKVTGSIESNTRYGFEINDGFNLLVYRNQTLVTTLSVPKEGFWDGEIGTSNRILVPYSFNVTVDPGDSLYFVQDPVISQRSDHASFTATAVVPEGSSLALFGIGAFGLALTRRRRVRASD